MSTTTQEVGRIDGVGVTYILEGDLATNDYRVVAEPCGPVRLIEVRTEAEGLTWAEAMDWVRDRVALELEVEARS